MPSNLPTTHKTINAPPNQSSSSVPPSAKISSTKSSSSGATSIETKLTQAPSPESGARKASVDKIRAKWEQATFGKSAHTVTLEEHVKNLSSPLPEMRRASAEQLQYFPPEALRAISKLLLTLSSTDYDSWTAAYAYRAYLRQLKEKEFKIHPNG